jgi:hypothetical protein
MQKRARSSRVSIYQVLGGGRVNKADEMSLHALAGALTPAEEKAETQDR